MKKIISLLLCFCFTVLTLSPLMYCSVSASEYYIPAVTFEGLTPGQYRDTGATSWDGTIPADSEIITEGIWVDPIEMMGFNDHSLEEFPGDKTNMHGFIANDEDEDGKTESISAIPNNNSGLQFTLGVNTSNNFSSAKGIAIHIDCDHPTAWNGSELLWINLTLIDSQGNTFCYKPRTEAVGANAFYATLDDDNIIETAISSDGYGYWLGNRDGWYVIDLSVFEEGFDIGDITKINIKAASWWEANMTIADVGFVTDSRSFVYDITGYYFNKEIELKSTSNADVKFKIDNKTYKSKARPGQTVLIEAAPFDGYEIYQIDVVGADGKEIPLQGTSFIMPQQDVAVTVNAKKSAVKAPKVSEMYAAVWDLSGINSGSYRDGEKRDFAIDTANALYANGVIVNREKIGAGSTATNFHGFWADDFDNDGVVERLRVEPHDKNGIRFTAGISTSDIPENSEAIAIRIDNQISKLQPRKLMKLNLAFYDSDGNSAPLKTGSYAGELQIHFIADASGKISSYNLKDTTAILPGKGSGWVVVPLAAFDGLDDIKDYNALAFDLESDSNTFTAIYEIGITNDMDEIIKVFSRNPTMHEVKVGEAVNGTVSADYTSAAVGTTVKIDYSPDDGYVFDAAKVKYQSGKEYVITDKSFVMPNESVTVTALFKDSPYKSAKLLKDVKTSIIDIDLPTEDYYVGDGLNDFSELFEKGLLARYEDESFRLNGSENSYNLNGLYIEENDDGDKGLRLWPYNNLGMSVTLKADKVSDSVDYKAIAVYIDNRGTNEYNDPNGPYFTLELYPFDSNGEPDMSKPKTVKATDKLWGTKVHLIDDETGIVTEQPLGYSPEDASKLNADQKYYTRFFLPDGFKGWMLIPFDYFGQEINARDIGAVRFNYGYCWWYYMSVIYEVALVPSMSDFLRIAGLPNYEVQYEQDEIEIVDKSVFELYEGTARKINITVNKDYTPFYTWTFEGKSIKKAVDFNPEIKRFEEDESKLSEFYDDYEGTLIYNIAATEFPAEANVKFDVSWDYLDGTKVSLYRYDMSTGKFTELNKQSTVSAGYVSFSFKDGGYYAISSALPTKLEKFEGSNDEKEDDLTDKTIITDTITVTDKRGHYETVPGKEKYKTVTKITYDGLATWFIIVLVATGVVLVAGSAVTVVIIKRRRAKKI